MTGSPVWRKLNSVTAESIGARQRQVQGNERHSQSDLTPAQSQKGLDRLGKQREGGLNNHHHTHPHQTFTAKACGPGQMGLRRGAEPGPMCPTSCASPNLSYIRRRDLFINSPISRYLHILFQDLLLPTPSLPRKVFVINSNFTIAEPQKSPFPSSYQLEFSALPASTSFPCPPTQFKPQLLKLDSSSTVAPPQGHHGSSQQVQG